MKKFFKIALLALTFTFIATSCTPEKDKDGWLLFFGFTSDALLGDYYPNPELWENDLPADHVEGRMLIHYIPLVDAECYVHRWTVNNYDNLQFEFSGFPDDVANTVGHNFTTNVYYANNNFSFSLNNDSEVTVYKDSNGHVRLHGWIGKRVGINVPYGYDVADEWNYYFFDIIK